MKNAEDFLIERNIVIKGAERFPLNLSRDTHVQSKIDIVQAMEDYADYKHSFLSDVSINEALEEINTIMWESFMIKEYPFGRLDGTRIMIILEEWASTAKGKEI